MEATKKFLFVSLFLIFIGNVNAAVIEGNIYNFDLSHATNVILEVNSTPKQTFLSKNGEYKFILPPGSYLLKATKKVGTRVYSAEENITIINYNGSYIRDIFIFLDLDDDYLNLTSNITIDEPYESSSNNYVLLIFFVIVLAVLLFFIFRKPKPKEEESNSEKDLKSQLIDLLRKNNRRLTQKEIRKNFPLSESKISLIISELEEEGRIKKIKKGRSNVIILK